MSNKSPILYLVIPCYNEEEVIEWSYAQLKNKFAELIAKSVIAEESRLVFVNDGSRDNTRALLENICKNDAACTLINFTRNFGHQNAILAGMLYSKEDADAVITIDADLQQDINAIGSFIDRYQEGNDIVYGIRNDRSSDGSFKKASALLFYRFMRFLGCDVIENSADYRLLSRKALEALDQYTETNLFLRGLIPLMGFKSDVVNFDVKPRTAGTSKYSLKKMVNLAADGITSLSIKPIHIVSVLGAVMCLFSIFMMIFSFVTWLRQGVVPGYTTIVISIWLVGGVCLLSQGIIGEYIGKMYFETKKRPRFIIDSVLNPVESGKGPAGSSGEHEN